MKRTIFLRAAFLGASLSIGMASRAAEQAEPAAVGYLREVSAAAERGDCHAALPLAIRSSAQRHWRI